MFLYCSKLSGQVRGCSFWIRPADLAAQGRRRSGILATHTVVQDSEADVFWGFVLPTPLRHWEPGDV